VFAPAPFLASGGIMPDGALDTAALEAAAAALVPDASVAVVTGAGISAESGVPTFRGPGGLWRSYRPEDLATPEAFGRDPALVWEWYRWRRQRIADASPNAGHAFLAYLQRRHRSFALVTQNVDGLHQRAGSRHVVELHGNIFLTTCACGFLLDESPGLVPSAPVSDRAGVPQCPRCDGPMRPGVVWFGESLPAQAWQDAAAAARRARVLLVIGTSGLVYPAASLPALTRQAGGLVIEINPDITPLTPVAAISIRSTAAAACAALETLV
jgi:NAD-dependent deacetylase